MSKRIKLADNPFLVTRPIQPAHDQRAEVLRKFARCGTTGIPIRCVSSAAERAQRAADGLAPIPEKVIFPDKHAANQAGKALQKLGMDPMTAYVCERSKSGHAHLTRKGAK